MEFMTQPPPNHPFWTRSSSPAAAPRAPAATPAAAPDAAPARTRHAAAASPGGSSQPGPAAAGAAAGVPAAAAADVLVPPPLAPPENVPYLEWLVQDWLKTQARRTCATTIFWPTCHIMDNKLMATMKKPGFGEVPSLLFYYKNDAIPLEFNPTTVPLSGKGVRHLLAVGKDFSEWIQEVCNGWKSDCISYALFFFKICFFPIRENFY